MLLFNIALGLLVQLILGSGTVSANQNAVNEGLRNFPFLNMFATIVFAPIVEEIVFRGALYQSLRSEKSYYSSIAISCFLFGLIHILPSMMTTGDLTQLIYLIPYSGMAIFMIMAFEVTGSIWGAIFVHMLNNAFATLTVILPMFLG
ncbi:CPBP family intramembrane metalloprotease [Erysipelothrix sp. Poltava]|nr:CPBP family intramembrane metalloprotease [Erysipelothrix sp. Poltava]